MTFKNEADYKEQRKALITKAENLLGEGKRDEAQKVMDSVKQMDSDFESYKTIQANLRAMSGAYEPTPQGVPEGTKSDGTQKKENVYNSEEYRTAFMNHILAGAKIPEKFRNGNEQTTTSEVSSVIPTVLVQKIYTKLDTIGRFFSRAEKTNFKGGVTIPTDYLELIASWVGERGQADTQEAKTGSVMFAYHKLMCKVAVSFESAEVTLDIFEANFVNKVSKAMIKAIEKAMFTGTGDDGNQMTGFLTETVADGQNVDITEGNHITYADIVAMEAALPSAYEAGAIWVMPKKTFYKEIIGMTDENGQPIGRIGIGLDGKPEPTILGRHVEYADDYMSPFTASVSADTIVAAIFDFSHYGINTNYQMTIKKYTDEDTDDQITKALMLVDGKTIDKNSLVTMTLKNG